MWRLELIVVIDINVAVASLGVSGGLSAGAPCA
jgi:hypothetical protein